MSATSTELEFAERIVRTGIRVLDEYIFQWREKINVDALDVESATMNPLAQAVGTTINGLLRLGMDEMQAIDHGFLSHPGISSRVLNETWRKLIRA